MAKKTITEYVLYCKSGRHEQPVFSTQNNDELEGAKLSHIVRCQNEGKGVPSFRVQKRMVELQETE